MLKPGLHPLLLSQLYLSMEQEDVADETPSRRERALSKEVSLDASRAPGASPSPTPIASMDSQDDHQQGPKGSADDEDGMFVKAKSGVSHRTASLATNKLSEKHIGESEKLCFSIVFSVVSYNFALQGNRTRELLRTHCCG